MICGATVFLSFLFCFVLFCFICPILWFLFFLGWSGDVKQTLKLLVILHVALFNCLSIIIADQNNSFYGQVGSVTGQTSIER